MLIAPSLLLTGVPMPLSNTAVLVRNIARELVDRPDDLRVSETVGSRSTIIEVEPHPSDVGRFLGKRGAHADAIRILLTAIGGKQDKRYVLEVIEPENVRRSR